MYRAGDRVTVLEGPEAGQTLTITSVRKYGTYNGYYLSGGSGLYSPRDVTLAEETHRRKPCGTPCDDRDHKFVGDCDHCRGQCNCELLREIAAIHDDEK
ncbi:hypothetical protein ABZ599_37545 [Streptomyces misionensis]|uniref:hypothetical protein n=1 Tax=Streptomyces misionensis TaxID=67331 RepID=UPI0033D29B70